MSEQNQKPPINVDYFEDLTGDIAKTSVDRVESVGERIRVLRQEKGLSLEEVSRLTGFEVISRRPGKQQSSTTAGNLH